MPQSAAKLFPDLFGSTVLSVRMDQEDLLERPISPGRLRPCGYPSVPAFMAETDR
jgi:hypothetical protein